MRALPILPVMVAAWLAMTPFVGAQTTFIGSTIERIDRDQHQLTIRTTEGKTWSLEVAEPDLIKGLKEGDRASLELSLDGKVRKIVKSDEASAAKPVGQEKDQ